MVLSEQQEPYWLGSIYQGPLIYGSSHSVVCFPGPAGDSAYQQALKEALGSICGPLKNGQ